MPATGYKPETDPVSVVALSAHAALTESVHGLPNAAALQALRRNAGDTGWEGFDPATQAEIDAAIATIDAAITLKQDASTAASDAELASAVATLNAAIALKQDASTAATDAELASHTGNTSNPHAVTKTQVGLGSADNTSDVNKPVSTAQATALALKQALAEKGQANGYPDLDSGGKLPAAQLPSSAMEFKGAWDASTNAPTLADGSGSAGDQYRVSVAGTRNLGSGSIDFAIGDAVIYSGSVWEKSDNTESVSSVAGKTGVVSLVKGDVGLGSVDNTADTAKPVSTAQATAIALKQDAATAATDAELTSEASTRATADTGLDARLLSVESGRLLLLAYDPDALLVGTFTRDANGALTSASAVWPDGATGTFTGTPSTVAPGAIDAYTITHVAGATTTYTQPAMTRDSNGAVITRPAITVS